MKFKINIFSDFWSKFSLFLTYNKKNEVYSFNEEYNIIVNKYEFLLKKISIFLKKHRFFNKEIIQENFILDNKNSIDSFHLQNIRKELKIITNKCEKLLKKSKKLKISFSFKKSNINLQINQLNELIKYSSQIDFTLKNFEEKIIKAEEFLSKHTYAN